MTFHARSDSLCVRRPPAICDSDIIKEVEGLVQDVAEFATNLAKDLADFIDSLPTPSKLMRMAVDFVKEKLLSGDGLCVRPNCGGHVNSGREQNLVPAGIDDVEILASHHAAPTPRATIRPPPTRSNIATTHTPHLLLYAQHTVSVTCAPPRVCGSMCGTGTYHVVRLLHGV